jgi:DNA-directed RNA polymerase sigma subunit (sigma70/sigma32)
MEERIGLTIEEIAHRLGISKTTVMLHEHRALNKLREGLGLEKAPDKEWMAYFGPRKGRPKSKFS